MAKFLQITIHEYSRHVFRRRFIFALISLPAFILIAGLIIGLAVRSEQSSLPVGYIDYSGLIQVPLPEPFVEYVNESDAEKALKSRSIQGYYILESDFLQTSHARLVAAKPLGGVTQSQFVGQVRQRLLQNLPAEVAQRLASGNQLYVRSADGMRQFGPNDWPGLFLPIGLFLVFMLAIFSTSGYLMQAVTEEKENRTMEIVLTSVTSSQLMGGKIIGSLAIGMTQLIVWVGVILAAAWVGIRIFGFSGSFRISPGLVGLSLTTLLLSFVIIAAMMAAVGAVVTEATEGQQITGPFSLPFIIPFLFITQILTNPNGSLAVWLSLIPFTAPVTLALRANLVPLPAWQVALSLAIMACSAIFSLWLAGRLFRIGVLQYGKHLSLQQILGRLWLLKGR